MIRVYTFKLYPSRQQAARLESWLRQCCRLYNAFLEQRIKSYKQRGESVSYYHQSGRIKDWRSADARMADVPFNALRSTAQRLHRSFENFFRRCKSGEKPGFPRFKPWRRFRCLDWNQPARYFKNGRVAVPKLGLIRCRGGRLPADDADIRRLQVISKASGWYAYLTINDRQPAPPKREPKRSIGIDVGLSSFATTSDGEKIDNPRHLRRSLERLARVQRRLSRKKRGSRSRRKYAKRVARLHEHVENARKDFLHKTSRALADRYDLIAIEDLNMAPMVRGRMAKSVHDAGWGTFAQYLSYKAENAGATVVRVNPYGTTQRCSACGEHVQKSLGDRWHNCSCGFSADRDENAAINILNHGLRAVGADVTPAEDVANVGGGQSSPSSISGEAGRLL